jgi:1-acyl-sn-glycerol-3-phosphate acyltransferase
MKALLFVRTVVAAVVIAVTMPFFALIIGIFGERPAAEWALRSWCRISLFMSGARLVFRELEPIDRSRSYVFVSNHTSNMDVPAILACTPEPIRFIAKRELSYVPFFGWAAGRMGHVFVNRKDSHAAARAIRSRIDKGLSGIGLFFFAEGTRATTDELLPFKKGAAVAALNTGLDCVPIGVAGAREVLAPKGLSLFRPGTIAVVFGEVIPLAGHTLENRDALVQAQRAGVEAAVAEARSLVARSRLR